MKLKTETTVKIWKFCLSDSRQCLQCRPLHCQKKQRRKLGILNFSEYEVSEMISNTSYSEKFKIPNFLLCFFWQCKGLHCRHCRESLKQNFQIFTVVSVFSFMVITKATF